MALAEVIDMSASDYRCPPIFNSKGERTSDDTVQGWMRNAVQEGESFLKSQRAWSDLDRAYDIIAGPDDTERLPKGLSRCYVNRLKRQMREIVATESNLRPMWGFKSDNREYDDQCVVLNKLTNGWWHNTFADRAIRKGLQYAVGLGTGYVGPVWEKDFWCYGRGDIKLHTYGPRDVLPIQLPHDFDLQRAYAVIIRTEVPLAMAHAMYPEYADLIQADRTRPGWFRRGMKKAQRFMSPVLNLSDKDRDSEINCPVVDVYNAYIMDLSLNNTGHRIPMGDPGTYWEYEVPSLGDDIPTGTYDSAGRMLYRKATAEDSMMFPMRRLLTCVGSQRMTRVKDGTSPWWHGKVPLVKFTVDDWPWEYLGFSAIRDGKSIQDSHSRLMRAVDDTANVRLRPPLKYDGNVVSKTLMDRINTRQPGQTVDVNMSMGEAIAPLMPPGYYEQPAWIRDHIQHLEVLMDYVMATPDLTAIAKARQLPSSDTIEKILEMAGPIAQDISRNMEEGLRDLGDMVKSLFFEFYTLPRKVQILGENGIVDQDYDFDPGNMIPAKSAEEAATDYLRRARRHCNNFVFHVTPNSLHQITQMSRQLMLLQLQKTGFPIDPWTLAESFDLPNFGPAPEGTKNMIERWVAWTKIKGEMMTEMQTEAQQAMQGAQMQSQMQNAAAQVVGASNPPGRPASGMESPQIQTKDQGTRSTVAQSR